MENGFFAFSVWTVLKVETVGKSTRILGGASISAAVRQTEDRSAESWISDRDLTRRSRTAF